MMNGGDAAEQVVRLSLEGMEVAAKITGAGAKNIAVLLAAVLREEHKTSGKARLTNMIKSGRELRVFSIQEKDLKKFSHEAKRYGVLYCALRDKEADSPLATVDLIARAEDASKISRIMERFELASTDVASVVGDVEKSARDKTMTGKVKLANPNLAKTEKGPLSEPNLKIQGKSELTKATSVKEKLKTYASRVDQKKSDAKGLKIKAKALKGKSR